MIGHNTGIFIKYIDDIGYQTKEFSSRSIDPETVFKIAAENQIDGIIIQQKTAEKYHRFIAKVPFIIHLSVNKPEHKPYTTEITYAKKLGASALSYSIFAGSLHESDTLEDLKKKAEEAEKLDLPLFCWIEPKGAAIKRKDSAQTFAYLDLITTDHNIKNIMLQQIKVRGFGHDKNIWLCPRSQISHQKLIRYSKDAKEAGAKGIVIGKSLWEKEYPDQIIREISQIFSVP